MQGRIGRRAKSVVPGVSEVVRFGFRKTYNLNNPDYGIKSYKMTDTYQYDAGGCGYKIPALALDKEGRKNFADIEAKRTVKFPPAKYDIVKDWSKNTKGGWLKGPRVTESEECMKIARKRNVPGPIYKSPRGVGDKTITKENGSRDAKTCAFIDQAQWIGEKTPTTKLTLNYGRIEHSPRTPRMFKEFTMETPTPAMQATSRMTKILKEKSKPSPGEYNDPDSFKKTQLEGNNRKFSKLERTTFVEVAAKRKKIVPGAGTYHYDVTKVFNALSSSPRCHATKRH